MKTSDFPVSEESFSCGILVVGSGIAGMLTALQIDPRFSIILATKQNLEDGSTSYAQGGIAFAIGPEDSVDLHVEDTLKAGGGFCDETAVRIMVDEGRRGLDVLQKTGTRFDYRDGTVSMHREGGHSVSRVAHHGDSTGAEVSSSLAEAIRAAGNIQVLEHAFVNQLISENGQCSGARCIVNGRQYDIHASAVVIASGGAGQMYSVTTNPSVVTGDGIAAAYAAGARITDIEFIQFHPTALYEANNPRFLISEAVRGEGAHILNLNGDRIMPGKHPLAELAPRDVVVRAMALHMIESGDEHLWLDVRHLDQQKLSEDFPMITGELKQRGYNTASDLIPISFAAHYTIGGIATDLTGRSSLKNCYACGETACTGVHGANRLASNSLLEAIVFSARIAGDINSRFAPESALSFPQPDAGEQPEDSNPRLAELRDQFTRTTFRYGGVFRSAKRLSLLSSHLTEFEKELAHLSPCSATLELENMMTICRLLIRAASTRTESRGTHQRQEFAGTDDFWHQHHITFENGRMVLLKSLDEGINW